MMHTIIHILLIIACSAEKSVKVDIYPGFGWDHLRFLDMNPIYDVSNFNDSNIFQSCIEMIPLHENKIETGSEVIDAFDSQSSEYSSNLMIGGKAGYGGFSIGGSYSNDYQKIKKEQGQEKTVTLRNHIDYLMVDVMLQSACPLHPQVKKDLIKIAEYATTGKVLTATYAAQMFVKKYGTHFTSRIYLGGSISEDDFISHSTFSSSNFDKRAQKAAAEASFLGTFSLSASFSLAWSSSQNDAKDHKENIQRKIIKAKGGDVLPMGNSIQAWQASIKSKPVIVRRAIENITYIIQSDKLPELSESALIEVRQKIREAIETYVDMNAIRGCMNRDSSSFNWVANIDDGSCAPASLDAQFGGFIQTCTEDERMPPKCQEHHIENFYTNTDECKSGFHKYLIHNSTQIESIYERQCYGCGFLWLSDCCDDIYIGNGQRDVFLYGCNKGSEFDAPLSNLMNVYGGSFTTKKENPVTNGYTCPPNFSAVKGPGDITLCLAERITVKTKSLPSYGGIYSCNQGNIATGGTERSCTKGFSAFVMGAIEGNCLLYVCLKFETFEEERTFPNIVLPPFFQPEFRDNSNDFNGTMQSGIITSRMIDSPHYKNISEEIRPKNDYLAIGLSVCAIIIGVLAFVTIAITQIRRHSTPITTTLIDPRSVGVPLGHA